MQRTREAILGAAAGCVEQVGVRKTTMSDIALTGGVAKATLYNHFRTKDDVLDALVDSRVAGLAEQAVALAAGPGLGAALEHAAGALAVDPTLRKVARDETAALLPLTVPGEARGWTHARACTVAVLTAAGAPAGPEPVDAVLRWLVGQVLWPATPAQARLGAEVLAGALLSEAPSAAQPPTADTATPAPPVDEAPAPTPAPAPDQSVVVTAEPVDPQPEAALVPETVEPVVRAEPVEAEAVVEAEPVLAEPVDPRRGPVSAGVGWPP